MSTAIDLQDILDKAKGYLPEGKLSLIEKAYQFAAQKHEGQLRMSGEPFIQHPMNTALHLLSLHLDAATIAAALLHDVMEDCNIPREELEERFGAEVAKLVDGVTKLSRIDLVKIDGIKGPAEDSHGKAESLRKMLVAMAEDIRVVLIKLSDRLHNMRTLRALPPERRIAIAQETMDIYAPLAHRLGIWDMKWRLEDLAFRYLYPTQYREISHLLATKREEREAYIDRVSHTVEEALAEEGIKAEVYGRAKHIYSIYEKMQKYAAQGKEFGQIYDLYALRIMVKTKPDCYNALGVVHNLWSPMPGQFDDYIANPKENLYQSLHSTVMCEAGTPLEVQIRTYDMHKLTEYGVAAHWRYKEGKTKDMDIHFEEKMTWVRQLLEWQRELTGTEEFLESVKTDIFKDQVFVYTPKGDIKELPAGSTPLDFAYMIHTDLGHRCIGAKVNGKLESLDHQLKNGDTLEIITSKLARGPSLDWLNTNLGYVHTARAREKIRNWFHKQERSANIQRGKELLHRELKRLNVKIEEEEIAQYFKLDDAEELLASLGSGTITIAQVSTKLTSTQDKPLGETPIAVPLTGPASGVQVLGVGDLLIRMARCCNPLPGEEIQGYITRTRGVTVHRKNCPNMAHEDETERFISVTWSSSQQIYPVRIRVKAWDRVGLLRDITTLVSHENVNISSLLSTEQTDSSVIVDLTVSTTGIAQLSKLFSKIETVRGVISATRNSFDSEGAAPAESKNKTNVHN